jgi:hypothetical protein
VICPKCNSNECQCRHGYSTKNKKIRLSVDSWALVRLFFVRLGYGYWCQKGLAIQNQKPLLCAKTAAISLILKLSPVSFPCHLLLFSAQHLWKSDSKRLGPPAHQMALTATRFWGCLIAVHKNQTTQNLFVLRGFCVFWVLLNLDFSLHPGGHSTEQCVFQVSKINYAHYDL